MTNAFQVEIAAEMARHAAATATSLDQVHADYARILARLEADFTGVLKDLESEFTLRWHAAMGSVFSALDSWRATRSLGKDTVDDRLIQALDAIDPYTAHMTALDVRADAWRAAAQVLDADGNVIKLRNTNIATSPRIRVCTSCECILRTATCPAHPDAYAMLIGYEDVSP